MPRGLREAACTPESVCQTAEGLAECRNARGEPKDKRCKGGVKRMTNRKSGLLGWIEARPLAVFALCFAAGAAIACLARLAILPPAGMTAAGF